MLPRATNNPTQTRDVCRFGFASAGTYQAAVRALAFKWIRILYRCWQTRTPYNESVYLNALKRRGSPLLNPSTNGKMT